MVGVFNYHRNFLIIPDFNAIFSLSWYWHWYLLVLGRFIEMTDISRHNFTEEIIE